MESPMATQDSSFFLNENRKRTRHKKNTDFFIDASFISTRESKVTALKFQERIAAESFQ